MDKASVQAEVLDNQRGVFSGLWEVFGDVLQQLVKHHSHASDWQESNPAAQTLHTVMTYYEANRNQPIPAHAWGALLDNNVGAAF